MDYFAANDMSAFSIIAGSPTEVTTAGRFDATYCTKAIDVTPTGARLHSYDFVDPTTGASVSLTDFWFHCESIQQSSNSFIEFYNSAGVAVLRLSNPAATTRRIDYWNGAAWVNGAVSALPGDTNRHIWDLHIVAGAAGKVELYCDNSAAVTQNGLNAAVTNVRSFRLYDGNTGVTDFSQFLASDVNTIGAKVASLVPNANGVNTAWANDFNNLVKLGFNDATLISSSTLGDKESYGATDATLPTAQYSVSSVWFAIRARLNGGAPANVKPLMRIGGVDYAGGYNFPGLSTVAFGPSIAGFVTDPSTGAAFVGVTNVNAAELGFQTAA